MAEAGGREEGRQLIEQPESYVPLPGGSAKIVQPQTSTYGQLTAYAVSVNYIIGAGVLGLPFATWKAGVPLTLTTLAFFSLFLVLGCWWVLEILSRAQGAHEAAVVDAQRQRDLNASALPLPHNRITFEKWPYSRFCGFFGGLPGKLFAQIVIGAYCYGALWAYTASFSSSLAMVVFDVAAPEQPECNIYHSPSAECNMAYYFSVGCYALIVLPLSMMEISEQQLLQLVLTGYRFFVFALMLLTSIAGLIANGGPLHPNQPSQSVWAFKWSGFGVMFPSAAVALCVHYNIPDALTPCRDKNHLRKVVTSAQLTALAFYAAIGALCAVYFNPPDPLITLNWLQFTGRGAGGWDATTGSSAAWWAVILRMLVILFPVIDLVNVFPLVVVTLSGNIASALPARWSGKQRKIVSRLLAALPPLILGAAVGRLDTIFTITGWFGFAIEFVVPTVFHWLSSRLLVAKYGKGADITPYSGWHSKPLPVFLTLAVGVIALLVAMGLAIADWASA